MKSSKRKSSKRIIETNDIIFNENPNTKSKCYACEKQTCSRSNGVYPTKCYDCQKNLNIETETETETTIEYLMKYPMTTPMMTYM